ncbi:DNA-binding protein SMUBP-2 [Wickerhamomyces ciferrii]|uniref:DNA-binding protein SMUBP-2 n=1 Tax=Wickerhamomyces ciferrii (strain ATCC 14091 / BCRC 22168 / CBS 111 / JCM 3599 / NBRC 0793 / NRRL Y-1031 F-60-10) TaxID=1206466 RepID=K0KLH4_WICCF|nr:DNA-binding protein SMUBP-2 [Wickerhamomyces ciferrii]CCH43062.1 DNA-binding protein SMUBP-2 [Wickerhamomyces ciferrii]
MSQTTSQPSSQVPAPASSQEPVQQSQESINNESQIQQELKESTPSTTPSKITKPKKKSKKLCQYKQCTNQHSIIGDCQFCVKKFCTTHRLLEAHDCEHYREVKNEYHERNAKLLQSQQTVVSKV